MTCKFDVNLKNQFLLKFYTRNSNNKLIRLNGEGD